MTTAASDNVEAFQHLPKMNENRSDREDIWETALDWLLRVHAAPEVPEIQQGLADWLAADPRHVEAYGKAEKVWRLTGHAAPAHAPRNAPPAPDSVRPFQRLRKRRNLAAAVTALAACLVLFLAWPTLQLHLQADTVSSAGEIARLEMPDGSIVTLGPRSAITSNYTPSARLVTLLSGEAFFEVAKDKTRPFSVLAAETSVTAVGTAFDVRLSDPKLTVEVAEGQVAVTGGGEKMRLSAGQRLTLDRKTHEISRSDISRNRVASWRAGRLIVERARLEQVVARIRPYLRGSLVVTDDSLLDHEVSGVYDLRRPVEAIRAAFQPHGASVHEFTPYLLVVTGG